MAFEITGDIKFIDIATNKTATVKAESANWKWSVDNYSSTASIKLPATCLYKRKPTDTATVLTEGMKVEIYAGYNGENDLRFKGFIRRRIFSVPLEIECEGYSYQLRKKEGYSKSYKSTTAKTLLRDLVEGTDIKLSDSIPDIPLNNIYFKNVKGTDVLEYLKDKCLLTVYFNHEVLYCGLKMTEVKATKNLRLNWNVIKDDELKFETNKELATVNIQIEKRSKDGTRKKAKHGVKDGAIKKIQVRHIEDEALLKKIAEQKREELVHRGYEGVLSCFLKPYMEPGMAANITDSRYPERTGVYFIEKVDGEFGPKGGRQKTGIGATL